MAGKKDFSSKLKKQVEDKKSSIQEDKIFELENNNKELLQKIKEYESKKDIAGTIKIKLDEIIEVSNIRDNLDYEEIEELARNIKELGQLQPVLITSDNYLIAGYRRFNAIKLLGHDGPGYIFALKLDTKFQEIAHDLFLKIQYSENENRKSLDNFHISKLFNDLKKSGKSQSEISKIFGKTKGFVSSLIAIKNLHPDLVKLIKEFQVYAWSKKKFIAMNLEDEHINDSKFYMINKGVVGWLTLYNIAKHTDIEEQKAAFLKTFKNRLTDEELNSDLFKNEFKKLSSKNEYKFINLIKSTKTLSDLFSEVKENLPEEKFNEAKKYLEKFQNIIIMNSKKIK